MISSPLQRKHVKPSDGLVSSIAAASVAQSLVRLLATLLASCHARQLIECKTLSQLLQTAIVLIFFHCCTHDGADCAAYPPPQQEQQQQL
jgi:hypothetical protein